MPSLDPIDRDMMIRTVLGEARNQAPVGQAAVAHVILNRVRSDRFAGETPTEIVLQKHQFEPWQTRKAELMAIRPNDPAYQRAGKIVDAVAAGAPDPTNGATHFANVATVRDRNGGTVGSNTWINPKNETAAIGDHTFYAPDGPAEGAGQPFAYAEGATPAKGPALDAIRSATKGSPSMADDPFERLKALIAQQSQAQQQSQIAQNPLHGLLGRLIGHGLDKMIPGLNIMGTQPTSLPTSPATSPAAAYSAGADLPGGTNSDVPIPLPPVRPTDVGDAAPALASPPVQTAGAAAPSPLDQPIDLTMGAQSQNAGLPFPGMGADQNAPSPAFAANDMPGAGMDFGAGMSPFASLFGVG